MLARFTNILFAAITTILLIIVIALLIKLNTANNELNNLKEKISNNLVTIAEQKTKLNQKLVEVVHVPSTKYEEKIIHAKPVVEYVTKEAVKIVSNPIYLNMCFDNAGVQLTNDLIELGHPYDTTATSEPEFTMSETN